MQRKQEPGLQYKRCSTFRNSFGSVEEKPSHRTAQWAERDVHCLLFLFSNLNDKESPPFPWHIYIIEMCICFSIVDFLSSFPELLCIQVNILMEGLTLYPW